MKDEEPDEGIETEDCTNKMANISLGKKSAHVRSYVYGLETMINKRLVLGTGSLELRTSKQLNGNLLNTSDDWFNRRKSYGFEKVNSGLEQTKPILMKKKGLIETSIDSGICKSNDAVDALLLKNNTFESNDSSPGESGTGEHLISKTDSYTDYPPITTETVKMFSSIFEQNGFPFKKKASEKFIDNNFHNRFTPQSLKNYLQSTTVIIPFKEEHLKRQFSAGTRLPTATMNSLGDIKRHSIAVDETKYVNNSLRLNEITDEVIDEDNSNFNRKQKKVEFCKTEVHFAPDSGKINIIETDEKPPRMNNFRRRRRNSNNSYVEIIEEDKKAFSTLHFDGSYEKDLSNHHLYTENTVTVTTNGNIQEYFESGNENKENVENESRRGILKNKPVKPKPYILGDTDNSLQNNMQNSEIWGVKLKPVKKEQIPIWKSTVTLRNTSQKMFQPENENTKTETTSNFCSSSIPETSVPVGLSDNIDEIRIISTKSEGRNTEIQVQNNQRTEDKGFSTKVNIGGSNLTHVHNAVFDSNKNNCQIISSEREESKENSRSQNARFPLDCLPHTSALPNCNLDEEGSQSKSCDVESQISQSIYINKTFQVSKKSQPNSGFENVHLSSPSLVSKNMKPEDHFYETISEYKDCFRSQEKEEESKSKKSDTRSLNRKYKGTSIVKGNRYDLSNSAYPTCANNSPLIACVVKNMKKPDVKHFELKERTPFPISHKPFKSKCSVNAKQITNIESKEGISSLKQGVNSLTTRQREFKSTPHTKSSEKPGQSSLSKRKPHKSKSEVNRVSSVFENMRPESPIYENIDEALEGSKHSSKEFDTNILNERINVTNDIQVTNDGKTFNNLISDVGEQKRPKELESISELKSWKQGTKDRISQKTKDFRIARRTSSTSSIESTPGRWKSLNSGKSNLDNDNYRKKLSDSASVRAATKARRLQRASSREALLQFHASSSEDLSVKVETQLRKPKVVRRTKTTQLTITNGIEIQRKSTTPSKRYVNTITTEGKAPVAVLPEIRHRTAVSTIYNTAKKLSSKEKTNKLRDEDKNRISVKKKNIQEFMVWPKSNKRKETLSSHHTAPAQGTER